MGWPQLPAWQPPVTGDLAGLVVPASSRQVHARLGLCEQLPTWLSARVEQRHLDLPPPAWLEFSEGSELFRRPIRHPE